MGKTNQVGKSHTYPSNRQSYSKSRKAIEGRKKKFCFTKSTNSTASALDHWKKPSTNIGKKYIHIFFLEQKI